MSWSRRSGAQHSRGRAGGAAAILAVKDVRRGRAARGERVETSRRTRRIDMRATQSQPARDGERERSGENAVNGHPRRGNTAGPALVGQHRERTSRHTSDVPAALFSCGTELRLYLSRTTDPEGATGSSAHKHATVSRAQTARKARVTARQYSRPSQVPTCTTRNTGRTSSVAYDTARPISASIWSIERPGNSL